jgi:hypothetical protein
VTCHSPRIPLHCNARYVAPRARSRPELIAASPRRGSHFSWGERELVRLSAQCASWLQASTAQLCDSVTGAYCQEVLLSQLLLWVFLGKRKLFFMLREYGGGCWESSGVTAQLHGPFPLLLPPYRSGTPVVRRFTGGGTVVVDIDTLFVSFIMNSVRYVQ